MEENKVMETVNEVATAVEAVGMKDKSGMVIAVTAVATAAVIAIGEITYKKLAKPAAKKIKDKFFTKKEKTEEAPALQEKTEDSGEEKTEE